jgi:hypothetical protein
MVDEFDRETIEVDNPLLECMLEERKVKTIGKKLENC